MKQKIKGITLISLMITVIVILILTGVSIGMLTSENGILNNGDTAKENTEISEEKNILKASAVSALGANSAEGIIKEDLEYYLDQNIGDEDYILEEQDGQFLVTFIEQIDEEDGTINKGRQYKILEDATILEADEEYLIFKLQPNSIPDLEIGEFAEITAVTNMDGVITWTSTNPDVCSIQEDDINDSKIQIIGREMGVSQIVATVEKDGITRTAYCNIKVIETQAIRVLSVEIEKPKDVIDLSEEDKTMQLTAIFTPSIANSGTDLKWTSNNTNILDIDENGLVTGKSNGTAKVTVTTSNNKTATCDITVQTSPKGITLDESEITLNLSGTKEQKLNVIYEPQETNANKEITWTSSDSNIVEVDETGLVKAKANGTATITATTENGKTAKCTVNVTTGITAVAISEDNIILKPGDKKTITALIEPNDLNLTEDLNWTSSDTSVASITTSGNSQISCEITAKTPGQVTITAQNPSGTVKDSCTILILPTVSGTNSKYTLKARYESRYENVCHSEPYKTCKQVAYEDCSGFGSWLIGCKTKYREECTTSYRRECDYEYVGQTLVNGSTTINFQLSSYISTDKLKLEKDGISQVNVGNIQVVNQANAKYKINLTTSSQNFTAGTLSLKYIEGTNSIELYKWTISAN